MARLVDKTIRSDEILVRCLIRSYLNSKRTAIDNPALEPKVGEHDISLLRLEYTDLDFCVSHGQHLTSNPDNFVGLLYLTQRIVDSVNQWAKSSISAEEINGRRTTNGINCEVIYSPLDESQQYLPTDIDVYVEDVKKGWLPMHADLRYNVNRVAGGQEFEPNTRIRKYAQLLKGRVKYQISNDGAAGLLSNVEHVGLFENFNRIPLLSIIVPYYKASDYIAKTANKILSQALGKSVEVLFISNNDSEGFRALKDILTLYPREVVHYGQKKTSTSEVRNRGIELARGEYIWFVEADDLLPDGAVDNVLQAIEDYHKDVYFFQMDEFTSDGLKMNSGRKMYEGNGVLEIAGVDVLLGYYSFSPIQMCVIKRDFIFHHEMHFVDSLIVDLEFMPRLLLKTDSVALVPKVIYHYYHHDKVNFKCDYTPNRTADVLKLMDNIHSSIQTINDESYRKALYVCQFRLLRHVLCDPSRVQFRQNYKRWKINAYMPLFRDILRHNRSNIHSIKDLILWICWYVSPSFYKWCERRGKKN